MTQGPIAWSFGRTVDLTPYTGLGSRVDLSAKNPPNAYGAVASMRMNFEEVDQAPEEELNEIIWKSVKGVNSPMPPPVRRMLPAPVYRASSR